MIRPDGPERNGSPPARVPNGSASTSKEKAGNRHLLVPLSFELRDPKICRSAENPQARARRHKSRFGGARWNSRLRDGYGRAGRMAKAPVLKTGGRKPLQVRILCPPLP